MDISSIIIIFFIVLIFLIILRRWLNQLEEKTKLSDELVDWLKSSLGMFNSRLDNAAKVIGDLRQNIGEFSEIGRSMKDLEEFLRSPKIRGNIGEQVLNDLLAQNFPKQTYHLQFQFKSGERVDAVIKTSQGLIPIDSKFPMENFRRLVHTSNQPDRLKIKNEFVNDVKKHIQQIAKKYIRPDEKTVDYALMYIPSEAVFYEIINNSGLFDYAGRLRVLPVSPLSFYAYMKAILMSFEGQRIQDKAKEILLLLQAIKKDYEKIDEAFSILNKHINNAYNQLQTVSKIFLSLGQKLDSTRLLPTTDHKDNEKSQT